MANPNPDKRTTAYENIFGRPTAKPKGPQAQPAFNPAANNNPQYWAQQQQQQAQAAGYYPNQPPRWNSNPSSSNGNQYPYNQAGAPSFGSQAAVPFYQGAVGTAATLPGGGYAQDPIDRRASVAPSLSSQDPRNSYYQNGHQSSPPPQANSSDGFYGGATSAGGPSTTAASAYAASYYGGAAGSTNPLVDGSNLAGYPNPTSTPPPPHLSHHPNGGGPYASNQFSSHPPGAQSVSSFLESNDPSAPKSPPRLPSIDIHGGGSQESWFAGGANGGSSNGQHASNTARRSSNNNHEANQSNGTSTPTSPVIKVNNFEGGKENEGYPQSNGEFLFEARSGFEGQLLSHSIWETSRMMCAQISRSTA